MSGLQRALIGLGLLGVALAAVSVGLMLDSRYVEAAGLNAAIFVSVMATYIGVGLYAWWRRPANRFGAIMVATGFAAFLPTLSASNHELLFSIGVAGSALYFIVAVHMLLAFPTGVIPTRTQRRLIAAGYVLTLIAPACVLMFTPDLDSDDPFPGNAFFISDQPTLYRALDLATSVLGVGIVLSVIVVLVGRWRDAGPRDRPALAPLLGTGAAMIVVLAVLLSFEGISESSWFAEAASLLALGLFAMLPFSFLAGLRRSRAWQAGAVTELVNSLGGGRDGSQLRAALSDALGDPGLQVAYWLQDHYADEDGRALELPAASDPRLAVTEVEREGRRVGALVHDRALCDEPDLIGAVSSAAALALDNERLSAELRARIEELRRSRQRLLEIGMAERRRLERDLHDGAQQRLVSLSLQLGLVEQQLDKKPDLARQLLDGARTEARAALDDLRELARGIHPAVLTDRGLGPALEALAERALVPVEVAELPDERLPPAVEAAAYFVVAESLTNVAKYAHATHAAVHVTEQHGWALIEVRDDGVGGADPSAGTGLRGLAERLSALDGRLEIESAPGVGTAVRARVPCAPAEVRR